MSQGAFFETGPCVLENSSNGSCVKAPRGHAERVGGPHVESGEPHVKRREPHARSGMPSRSRVHNSRQMGSRCIQTGRVICGERHERGTISLRRVPSHRATTAEDRTNARLAPPLPQACEVGGPDGAQGAQKTRQHPRGPFQPTQPSPPRPKPHPPTTTSQTPVMRGPVYPQGHFRCVPLTIVHIVRPPNLPSPLALESQ